MIICVDAGPGGDTGVTPDVGDGGMRDTPDVPTAPVACGDNGQVGGHCRAPDNACTAGYPCQDELVGAAGTFTLRATFGIEQGEPDGTTGYFREVATPNPANDVPINIATGGFCTAQCDGTVGPPTMAGAPDLDCTACSSCSGTIGGLGILNVGSIYPDDMLAFGENTGWCRADCVFDPATNGGCPTGYTCSAGENLCIEACTTDTQCQFSLELSRVGLAVSTIDTTRGTCNDATGRCDWTTTPEAHVGDACEASSDCTDDIGLCLNGGTCAELQCNRATDTAMDMTFACDLEGSTRNGICLGFGGNNGAICIQGCNSADDCNPGNACLPLGATAGAFTGYCLGICDVIANDPDGSGPLTAADDENWPCQTDERCDQPAPSADDLDPNGACRPTCATDADCDAGLEEECAMVEGATYGFCEVPDQICSFADGDADCSFDQACDLVQFEGNLGLCVDRCTADTDCATAGDECQVDRGVCRTPCSSSEPCAAEFNCVDSLCEQRNT